MPTRSIELGKDDGRPRWYQPIRVSHAILSDDAALRTMCATMVPHVVERATANVFRLRLNPDDADEHTIAAMLLGNGDRANVEAK